MSGVLEMFGAEAPEDRLEGLPDDPRERFAELVRRRDAHEMPSLVLAQAALEEELLEELRKRHPRRKVRVPAPREASRWSKIKALCEPFAEHRDRVIERHVSAEARARDLVVEQRERIDAELGQLAPQLEVRPGTSFTMVHDVADTAYRSQPQSSWYAHGQAEMRALPFAKLGIEVLVREVVERGRRRRRDWTSYEVWAQIDALDLEVVRQRLEDFLPEAEWLQACHDRALNPRVYRPFLSWEAEDRHGVRRGGAFSLGTAVPVVRVLREMRDEEEVVEVV